MQVLVSAFLRRQKNTMRINVLDIGKRGIRGSSDVPC